MNVFFDVPSHNITDQSGYLELRSKISMLYLSRYNRQLIKYTLSLHLTELYSTDTHINVHYDYDWSSVANQTTKSSGFMFSIKIRRRLLRLPILLSTKKQRGQGKLEVRVKHIYKSNCQASQLQVFTKQLMENILYNHSI